jgi:hypothetical protein
VFAPRNNRSYWLCSARWASSPRARSTKR